MTAYIVKDGEQIEASSAEDLVAQMHRDDYDPRPSDQEFMVAMANRVKLQNGSRIRVDSADHFVEDLIAAGMIKTI